MPVAWARGKRFCALVGSGRVITELPEKYPPEYIERVIEKIIVILDLCPQMEVALELTRHERVGQVGRGGNLFQTT